MKYLSSIYISFVMSLISTFRTQHLKSYPKWRRLFRMHPVEVKGTEFSSQPYHISLLTAHVEGYPKWDWAGFREITLLRAGSFFCWKIALIAARLRLYRIDDILRCCFEEYWNLIWIGLYIYLRVYRYLPDWHVHTQAKLLV